MRTRLVFGRDRHIGNVVVRSTCRAAGSDCARWTRRMSWPLGSDAEKREKGGCDASAERTKDVGTLKVQSRERA